jgi:hypothetical protein
MPTKIILRWDIQPGSESEYFEFMVSEFIPGLKKMGITEPGVWYTAYGEAEQIFTARKSCRRRVDFNTRFPQTKTPACI